MEKAFEGDRKGSIVASHRRAQQEKGAATAAAVASLNSHRTRRTPFSQTLKPPRFALAVSRCTVRYQSQLMLSTCRIRYHSRLWDHRTSPPPPCACTAWSKRGVGVEPPF